MSCVQFPFPFPVRVVPLVGFVLVRPLVLNALSRYLFLHPPPLPLPRHHPSDRQGLTEQAPGLIHRQSDFCIQF